ncbi:uncharacterized protein PV09_00137 [Verruconis gallopava]|uniref:Knr4/Smi1-like domain-containing protein n=1 Tax=Verruconis gallopava TaxID=253628 RepID=A0A0D2BCS5_9PEZI|nr:uncharacterized protein PV09_00137 [Verruconis gallopava]KIW09209.1 hypothetical protein PV09_00137 [Verruconis gallopava]
MASVGSMFKDFWQALVSNDRHASHDSPYRTGQHVPLPQSRHAPLTSIATSAIESRTDLHEAIPQSSSASVNGHTSPNNGRMSPSSPYSPGMRSAMRRQSSERSSTRGSIEKQPATEIQMQNFNDGLPPPPPVAHSWKRIDRWVRDNYAELYENLCEGATNNDINELEHQLDCTLPLDVRESLMVHDGQEHGGRPTGIFFGCMLLDCEEIYDEWCNWRAVNEQYLAQRAEDMLPAAIPVKAFAGASSSSSSVVPTIERQSASGALWREQLQERQQSQPPNAVQRVYTHPAWIPLARDWGGNLIAVDLAPGPMGKWGQVILCGRDYDTKFVVARSWAVFLANVADDFSAGDKIIVDEENNELRFKPFKNADPPYMEILRWRCDQKYGRRPSTQARRGPGRGGLKINSSVGSGAFMSDSSPYASPISATSDKERGRSPHRFGGKAPVGSSPLRPMISSPLARVTEEASSPLTIETNSETLKQATPPNPVDSKLVSVDTPRQSGELPEATSTSAPEANGTLTAKNKENESVGTKSAADNTSEKASAASERKTSKVDSGIGDMGDMKTVEI